MQNITIRSWKCCTLDANLTEYFINSLEKTKHTVVRKNKNRTVYFFEYNGNNYYAKLNHPSLPRHKFRELFLLNKSKSEFNITVKLQEAGLPVIKPIGWGKKSFYNFFISLEAGKNFTEAREYWLNYAKDDKELRKKFLYSLSNFLYSCLQAGIKHPDFHLGNLLINFKDHNLPFKFVDTHGIKINNSKFKNLNVFHNGFITLLSSLIGTLSREEMKELLINSSIIKEPSNFSNFWYKIREFSSLRIDKRWKKRKKKIFEDDNRFAVKLYDNKRNLLYVKKDQFGKPLINLNNLSLQELKKNYEIQEMKKKKAIKKWLFSFYLEAKQIPHLKNPVVLLLKRRNSKKCKLLIPKIEICGEETTEKEKKEFLRECKACNIKVLNPDKNIIKSNGKVALLSSDPKQIISRKSF